MSLKAAVYDLSIYVGEPEYDIFSDILSALDGAITEDEKANILRKLSNSEGRLSNQLETANRALAHWWNSGHPSSELSDQQWNIVEDEFAAAAGNWPNPDSMSGQDIKGRVNHAVFDQNPDLSDPLVTRTAAKLLTKNPFLSTAIEILGSWGQFISDLTGLAREEVTMMGYLKRLWGYPTQERLAVRRLLVRIHSNEAVAYIQDREVEGVTEHNLYGGDHTEIQTTQLCSQIQNNLASEGIDSPSALLELFRRRGKQLLSQARWFEAKNGTQLKPSFDYVELALIDAGFLVCKPQEVGIRTIGYHSELSNENVRAYTNLKAIVNESGELLGILKAKFFREQEFPRRCKEEAFVGLTLKYHYGSGNFHKRFDVPLIMYVDMAANFSPPEYAVKRLISFGWTAVFSTDELIQLLNVEVG